ncbi:MAG: F0F1 ATP synthase subunit delta, partial [Psychromonas sp.]
IEKQSEKLLQTATKAANTEAHRLLEKARKVAEDLCLQQQATFQRQQQSLSDALTQQTQQEVFAITRQTLKDLADVELEEQILKVFLSQLAELDDNETASFISALAKNNSASVRSSFALSPVLQQTLTKALNERFATAMQIHFAIDADLVSGIEVYIDGQKLAWSISQYIDSLEQHFQQLVRDSAQHLASKQCNDDGNDDDLLTAEPALLTAEKRNNADD